MIKLMHMLTIVAVWMKFMIEHEAGTGVRVIKQLINKMNKIKHSIITKQHRSLNTNGSIIQYRLLHRGYTLSSHPYSLKLNLEAVK